jgi:dTMP kinase
MAGRQSPLFITFEGGEGSGKSSQINRLSSWMTMLGEPLVTTREPGGTEGAENIRDLLVTGDEDRWDEITENLLFMAARRDHIVKLIRPSLNAGRNVVSDRFVDSTYVYQGKAQGVDMETLKRLYNLIAGDLMPDITILLDVDPKTGLQRTTLRQGELDLRETRFEGYDLSFHRRIRQGYLDLAKEFRDRYIIIDANQTIGDVWANIQHELIQRYPNIFHLVEEGA